MYILDLLSSSREAELQGTWRETLWESKIKYTSTFLHIICYMTYIYIFSAVGLRNGDGNAVVKCDSFFFYRRCVEKDNNGIYGHTNTSTHTYIWLHIHLHGHT